MFQVEKREQQDGKVKVMLTAMLEPRYADELSEKLISFIYMEKKCLLEGFDSTKIPFTGLDASSDFVDHV